MEPEHKLLPANGKCGQCGEPGTMRDNDGNWCDVCAEDRMSKICGRETVVVRG